MIICVNLLLFLSVLEQLGGKQIVMQHLGHEDPNVRYEALLAVQKLMVHNWLVWILNSHRIIPLPYPHPGSVTHTFIRFDLLSETIIKILRVLNVYFLLLSGNIWANSWRRRTRTRSKAPPPSLARPKRSNQSSMHRQQAHSNIF